MRRLYALKVIFGGALEKKLKIYDVSEYWRKQAFVYIATNYDMVIKNVLRKSKEFIAYNEIDNSRFFNEEIIFSPLLKVLPQPFGWLFALGLPGLILLVLRNKLFPLPLIFAIGTVFATFIIFIAAARFRVHCLPLFAVGSGVFVSAIIDWKNTGKHRVIAIILLSTILGIFTFWSGKLINNTTVNPMEFAWGYVKMGQPDMARDYAIRQINIVPEDAGPHELLGYLALNSGEYQDAIIILSNATRLSPQHHITQYNLALSYSKTNQFKKSLDVIDFAINISPLPEYYFFKGQMQEKMGDIKSAVLTYKYIVKIQKPIYERDIFVSKAQERLHNLRAQFYY